MTIENIDNLTVAELKEHDLTLRREVGRKRLEVLGQKLKNYRELREGKKEIARIQTRISNLNIKQKSVKS